MLVLLLISAKALQCDLTLNTGICIYSGNNVVRPFTKPSGVNGFWTFDDVYGLDYSGNGNHAKKVVPAGHSSGGRGSSARFSGKEYIEIPSSDSISLSVFSMTF